MAADSDPTCKNCGRLRSKHYAYPNLAGGLTLTCIAIEGLSELTAN